ncbi:MAG: gliding motility-associated C-terminal domain-containing protein, partial [Flavobacteriales bacterium]|nr:gliding motility-associated C-terminal domain-containing protein [Flavobacteriales bacterium]
ICWHPVTDPDLLQYDIFVLNPLTGGNSIIGTVMAPDTCFIIPVGSNNSEIEIVSLEVVARDNCTTPSQNVGSNQINTMFLESSFDKCAESVALTWNAYDDFVSGTSVLYSVYVSIDGGTYTLTGTSLTTDYTYPGIIEGSTYDFYIMAIENIGAGPFTSSSNDVRASTTEAVKVPIFNYLFSASVVDSAQVSLQFYVDTNADVNSYSIKRSISLSGQYSTVGSVNKFTGMSPTISYTDDNEVDANKTFYYYKIEALNVCGVEGSPSNIGRTIWLDVISNPIEATNTLSFTPYEGWLGGVQMYDIYRSVAGVWESTPITTLSSFNDTMVYVDDITEVFEGNGEFCYKIIAKENPAAHVGGELPLQATSISNEACALHEPLLYVPNAFIPSGIHNLEFKPILTFSDPTAYLFQIYNKWGQKIFETKDVNEAWNGRMNNSGEMSQAGVYVYLIQFVSAKGEEFSKRGIVTLIN